MKAGSVLVYEQFVFHNGGIHPRKLILILNTPKANENYLLIPTTSQQHRRLNQPGCHSEQNYYFIAQGHTKFIKDTWIVFHEHYTKSQAEILKGLTDGKIKEIFEIETTLWNAIKNCILKSPDLPGDYEEMISRG